MSVTYSDTLTILECGKCGITFAVPETWRRDKQEKGTGWYCPNGDSRVYKESDVTKLTKQLEAERTRRIAAQDQAQAAERSRSALQGVLTKTRQRIAHGVCPECHRQFQNVQRHMKSKHASVVNDLKTGVKV